MNGMRSNMGHCTLCGRQSACVCQRCRDFYCSSTCQKDDWPRHRYICFPMPALVAVTIHGSTAEKIDESMPLMSTLNFAKAPKHGSRQYNHSKTRNSMDDNISVASAVSSSIKQSSKAILAVPKMPKANSMVAILSFHSANRCFIRPVNTDDNAKYNSIQHQIDRYGRRAPLLNGKPMLNSYVMAEKNGAWYRAQVVSIQKSIKVLFMDLGITAQRNLKELREISNEILELQLFTFMVQLYNVANYKRSDEIMVKFQDYESKEYRIEYLEDDVSGITVKLYNWSTEKLLNDEINEQCEHSELYGNINMENGSSNNSKSGHTKNDNFNDDTSIATKKPNQRIKSDMNAMREKKEEGAKLSITVGSFHCGLPKQAVQSPIFIPPFEVRFLDLASTNMSVIVTDFSSLEYGYIGVMPSSTRENFNEIHKYLTKYKNNNYPSYKPKVDEYCIANFENSWFRAKVIEITNEDEYNVVYIDFTNEATITSDQIRRYPRDLINACYSNLCLIHGFPEKLNESQHKILTNFLNNKKEVIVDRVKLIDDNIVHLECKMITDYLISKT